MIEFLFVAVVPAFIVGFCVGSFAPAKWWDWYVFVGGSVITPVVLTLIWAFFVVPPEARDVALGWGCACFGPSAAIISVLPALLGGFLAQRNRKRMD